MAEGEKTKTAAKTKKTKKTVVAEKKAPAEKKASLGFIFFNCNEEKNQNTMNIFYENNRVVYRETKASRKALWEKIQSEIAAERISIDKQNVDTVKDLILEGNPTDASQHIHCGTIISITCL